MRHAVLTDQRLARARAAEVDVVGDALAPALAAAGPLFAFSTLGTDS